MPFVIARGVIARGVSPEAIQIFGQLAGLLRWRSQ